MAASQGAGAVGVVLSGTGSGGTLGLARTKEAGGLTLVQDPDEAEHNGMPRSAIREGVADLVLPVAEIARRLGQQGPELARTPLPDGGDGLGDKDEEALKRISAHLHACTQTDFSHYKRSTVLRRIGRRMQVNGADTLPDYLGVLRERDAEGRELLRDLLITVTNFFRDEGPFGTLREEAIPRLFENRDGPDDTVRVWVAGCATGEEAYSVAMLLREEADRRGARADIQLFATDLSTEAVATARKGLYPTSIETDLSEERLRAFFGRESGGYRVRQRLREIVVFADHDLMNDPPFSRLDLITCRNLLIYLKRAAQERVFEGAGAYLRFPTGAPSQNVLEVIHPKLRSRLRTALFRSLRNDTRKNDRRSHEDNHEDSDEDSHTRSSDRNGDEGSDPDSSQDNDRPIASRPVAVPIARRTRRVRLVVRALPAGRQNEETRRFVQVVFEEVEASSGTDLRTDGSKDGSTDASMDGEALLADAPEGAGADGEDASRGEKEAREANQAEDHAVAELEQELRATHHELRTTVEQYETAME
jgi:chemotaxis methyl-accepting protein methylase